MTTEILKDYIIYKLYCKNKEITDEYYGHTCAFRARKCQHKNCCNNENSPAYNTDKYNFIRLNGGWDNWIMSPIEELKNCSSVNAKIREQFYIDLNKSEMNTRKSYITEKQYYLENRDKILEKMKEYRLENRDKILEKNKEKMTCICGKSFTRNFKSHHERTKFHCQFIQSAM